MSAKGQHGRQANEGETYDGLNASSVWGMDLLRPINALDDLQIRGQPADQPWARGNQCGRSIRNGQSQSSCRMYNMSYLREVINDLVGALQSQLALLLEAASGINSDGQVLAVVLSLGEILNVFKITK